MVGAPQIIILTLKKSSQTKKTGLSEAVGHLYHPPKGLIVCLYRFFRIVKADIVPPAIFSVAQ